MKRGDLVHLSIPTSNDPNDYLNIFEEPNQRLQCSTRNMWRANSTSTDPNLIGRMYFGETGILLDQKIYANWYKVLTSSGSIGWLYTADLEALDETKTR